MAEELQSLEIRVGADTKGAERNISALAASLDLGLGKAGERAGSLIESSLLRAVRTGKLGFEDLKRVALQVMAEIASSAIRSGLETILGQSQSRSGTGGLLSALGSVLGLPGRATGGPVSPGRAFVVGERGPEVFVPTSSGHVAPVTSGGVRDVKVSISVNAPAGAAPDMLARSSRQVARAVRAALAREE